LNFLTARCPEFYNRMVRARISHSYFAKHQSNDFALRRDTFLLLTTLVLIYKHRAGKTSQPGEEEQSANDVRYSVDHSL
jgi:hypothetical protein